MVWILPCPFLEIRKKPPNLEKNTLIIVIYGQNFSLKVQFLTVARRKNRDVSLQGLSISCCRWLFIKDFEFPENFPPLEFYFRFERFILLVQRKKVISMNYGSSTSCWKPWRWVRFDMILTMRNIYINSNLNPFTKFNNSSRSTECKDILPWNVTQMMMKTIPITMRVVI